MPDDTSPKVEVFHRVNRLKLKAGAAKITDGPGRLDQTMVEKAEMVIQKASDLYPMEIKKCLDALDMLWEETKKLSFDARKENAVKISNTANQIKDLAGTFGFDLMEYFGNSLRDYILDIDLSQKHQITIVQAHIDVMQLAYKQNLKHQEHPLADELKKTVAAAIEKYS